MLTLTPSAVQAVDAILHSSDAVPDDAGLRIGTDGDAHLTVELVDEPAPGDAVIEEGGARVFVDPEVSGMLDDAQLEARAEGDQVAFGLAPQHGGDGRVA